MVSRVLDGRTAEPSGGSTGSPAGAGTEVITRERVLVMADGYRLPLVTWRPLGTPLCTVIALHAFGDFRLAFAEAGPALARRIEIAAYRDCDVLIAVSEPLKSLLVERCGIEPEKILIVPNAVELDRFDPALNGHERFFAEPTLGFVGGLIAWQALDLLLEALAALRAEGIVLGLAVR